MSLEVTPSTSGAGSTLGAEPLFPGDELDEAGLLDAPSRGGVPTYVALVRLIYVNRVVTVDAGDHLLARGELLIVETERGLSLAAVVREPACARPQSPLLHVVRKAGPEDRRQEERNRHREEESFRFCWQRIRERGLQMKLIKVEYLHGGNKAVFYFAADGRIDFRDLVKDLAFRLHTRVEMRQIGVRDASKMIGGLGPCGRELCCSSWMQKFEPVSIRMAKTQNLSLNPQKVSGVCGRLMCCLAYEQESYQALRKRLPRVGKNVQTGRGHGRVTEIDILRQEVRVTFPDGTIVEFDAPQVHVLPGGPDDRDLDDVPEELRHLEDPPADGHRTRIPVEGREILVAPKGARRKPWQDGRVPGGSAPPQNADRRGSGFHPKAGAETRPREESKPAISPEPQISRNDLEAQPGANGATGSPPVPRKT